MRFSVECAFPHLGKRGGTSRKSAVWGRRLTERRILRAAPHGKAHSAGVTLTENRILGATPHGKAQSGWFGDRRVRFSVTPSPKSAVWPPARRQTALFGEASVGECAFP